MNSRGTWSRSGGNRGGCRAAHRDERFGRDGPGLEIMRQMGLMWCVPDSRRAMQPAPENDNVQNTALRTICGATLK